MRREDIIALNRAAGECNVRYTHIDTDWDGMPIGTTTSTPAVVVVTRSELNVNELTDEDVPHLRVLEI